MGFGLHTELLCGNLSSYHTNATAAREIDSKARFIYPTLALKLVLIGPEKMIGKETRILPILLRT